MFPKVDLTARAFSVRERFARERFTEKVKPSADLDRILALPRRPVPSDEEQEQMAAVMTALLRRDNPACRCAELRPGIQDPCITRLFPVQGWYLWEAMQVGGALGLLAVGAGKTGVDVLLPMVLGVERACLLIPPSLREQFAHDFECWAQHFKVPNLAGGRGVFSPGRPVLDVLAYSELSTEGCAQWLTVHKPEVLIGDEIHALKDKNATRTDRMLRFYCTVEGRRLCGHSGSLTTASPDDYAHLSALALGEGSPVPIDPHTAGEWSMALGSKPVLGPGALEQLCEAGEAPRSGFRRRLIETLGVISTTDAQIDTKIRIRKRRLDVPPAIAEALRVQRKGTRPDLEELAEKVEIVAACKQLACGFFYFWRYPHGEPEDLILEWFAKRKAWNAELRARLEHRREWLDSPALCRDAAQRAEEGYTGPLPVWRARAWAEWRDIEARVQPEPDVEWLDDFMARDAVEWAKGGPGIIWYTHDALGRRIAELGGLPLFEGGDEAAAAIRREDGTRVIVASANAHGTGRNLQAFNKALITTPLAKGQWEQVIGRMHRPGQRAPVVDLEVYLHTQEFCDAFRSGGLEASRYVEESTGKKERLLMAEGVDRLL